MNLLGEGGSAAVPKYSPAMGLRILQKEVLRSHDLVSVSQSEQSNSCSHWDLG